MEDALVSLSQHVVCHKSTWHELYPSNGSEPMGKIVLQATSLFFENEYKLQVNYKLQPIQRIGDCPVAYRL